MVVSGMGGLGKTQLAVEFAWRYGGFFRGVHWLNLTDPSQLDSEIARCGLEMNLTNWPDDHPSQVALTLNTWKADGLRLLILDNFEDVGQVNSVLTRLRHSSLRLLVTSRRTDWTRSSGLEPLALDLFSPEESIAFLRKSLEKRKDSDGELTDLAERLGHLPLALELASRYLDEHLRLPIEKYLEQAKEAFEHPSMKGWREDMPAPTQHDLDLQRTFALSFNALEDETAKRLFLSAGYLAPNTPIPLELLEKALEISADECDEMLSRLYGLGLLSKSELGQPAIHPLLKEFARASGRENKQVLELTSMALKDMSLKAFNTGLPTQFFPYRPHLPVCAIYAEEERVKGAELLWNVYGRHLKMVADYEGAYKAYQMALKICKSRLGERNQDIARILNDIGSLFIEKANYSEARNYLQQALEIYEEVSGKEHIDVASVVNNLGMVAKDLGDHAGAKTAFERAINIWETAFGFEHPRVALSSRSK